MTTQDRTPDNDPASTRATVIYVGAGPGNPDLITVRAREVITHARTVLVDELVPAAIVDLVASELPVPQADIDQAERDYEQAVRDAKAAGARKKPQRTPLVVAADVTTIPQDTGAYQCSIVVEEAVAAARPGSTIVRLVCGNPLSDDRVLTELTAVANRGIDFAVVPGMPLPATVSTFAGMPHGSTYTATNITGPRVEWDRLAAAPQPLVLQATYDQLGLIASQLTKRGMSPLTPASVTVNGTTRLQRTYDTGLGMLGKLDGPLDGLIVVTVGLGPDDRSKYSWWENRALYGWRVLVPRAKAQAASMSTRLVTHGAIPQEVPTISVEPPRNPAQMERAVKGIVEGRYQWIVFTSTNAVTALWDKMCDFGLDARDFAGIKIAAVGHKTAAAIRQLGISPNLTPPKDKQNAAGLVEVFSDYDPELDPVGRVLFPCADIVGDTLIDGLDKLGWEVDDVVAYRTVRAAPPSAEIRDMIKSGGFDAVCFTSPSTVKNLVGIAGKPHQRTVIGCIGPATAEAAAKLGLRVDVVPDVAGTNELVDALARHVAGLRAAGQLPPPRKKRRRRAASPHA